MGCNPPLNWVVGCIAGCAYVHQATGDTRAERVTEAAVPAARTVKSVLLASIVAVAAGGWLTTPAAGATQAAGSVRAVQQRLAELTFLPRSQVDGKLGPRTVHAITAFQQWHGLTPDGVAGPRTLAKLRTAHAPQPGRQGPSHRIEVHISRGVTLLVDRGKVTRAIHSSAGRAGYLTPTGSYRVERKVIRDWSHPYRVWMPYASYFVGGYALHEGAVQGTQASHGCVRLPPGDAADAYRFATVGTAVIVY